ncbi:MAG: hypothetical protein U0Q18_25445 [Bryobacteraceae bacterium]
MTEKMHESDKKLLRDVLLLILQARQETATLTQILAKQGRLEPAICFKNMRELDRIDSTVRSALEGELF